MRDENESQRKIFHANLRVFIWEWKFAAEITLFGNCGIKQTFLIAPRRHANSYR